MKISKCLPVLMAGLALAPMSVCLAQGDSTPASATGHHEARINGKDTFGMTPLAWAANEGLQDEVELLLSNGANPNVKDEYGMTALHYAAWDGRADIVSMLLQRDAKLNIKDEDGMTPLNWAAMGNHTDVVEMLLSK